jgi:hypothetical protein
LKDRYIRASWNFPHSTKHHKTYFLDYENIRTAINMD